MYASYRPSCSCFTRCALKLSKAHIQWPDLIFPSTFISYASTPMSCHMTYTSPHGWEQIMPICRVMTLVFKESHHNNVCIKHTCLFTAVATSIMLKNSCTTLILRDLALARIQIEVRALISSWVVIISYESGISICISQITEKCVQNWELSYMTEFGKTRMEFFLKIEFDVCLISSTLP